VKEDHEVLVGQTKWLRERQERREEKRVSTLERSGFIAHAIARVKEDHEVLVGQTKWLREGEKREEREEKRGVGSLPTP
jgi:hypothetical protein